MNRFLLFLIVTAFSAQVRAQDKTVNDGLFFWVQGDTICYKLETKPVIVTSDNSIYIYASQSSNEELYLDNNAVGG